MKFLTLIISALFLLTRPAMAQVETYTLDKPHTQVIFFVEHLGFSHSEGKFLDYSGKIILDRAHPENSSVDIVIPTASLNMDDAKWDEHMKSADFFNVEKFPEMTFKSTKVEVLSDNTANVTGDLTLLSVTKPVTLQVTHNKTGQHPMNGKTVSGFSAHGMLKRSDFGMTNGLPMVGDDVEIRIEVEAVREDKEGQEPLNP
jgi:polyisoprenoid-binding protein YceI